MDLEAYINAIAESSPDDWFHHDPPLYLGILSPSYQGKRVVELDVMAPSGMLVFKRNLSVTLAYGIEHEESFAEEWARGFPDPNARSYFLDFFYNSALVYRDILVSVDGGRCKLPLPPREMDVPRRWYRVAQLIHGVIGGTYNFDDYARRGGLKIVDKPWPE
ncbi:MAG TPA: hypothetical protein VF794_16310 [Archangium sp.]|jgi:hypothetical protein|uniref:hypothetical protein n=1 Tax=Archangium sp. TaxID=1872627 RepID=UPI002ED8B401